MELNLKGIYTRLSFIHLGLSFRFTEGKYKKWRNTVRSYNFYYTHYTNDVSLITWNNIDFYHHKSPIDSQLHNLRRVFFYLYVLDFFPGFKRLFYSNFPNLVWYDNKTPNTFGLYICRTLKVSQVKILNCQHDDGERIRFWFSLWRTLVTANGTVSVV